MHATVVKILFLIWGVTCLFVIFNRFHRENVQRDLQQKSHR